MVDIDEIQPPQFEPFGYKSTVRSRGPIILLKSSAPSAFARLSNVRALSSLMHAQCRRPQHQQRRKLGKMRVTLSTISTLAKK